MAQRTRFSIFSRNNPRFTIRDSVAHASRVLAVASRYRELFKNDRISTTRHLSHAFRSPLRPTSRVSRQNHSCRQRIQDSAWPRRLNAPFLERAPDDGAVRFYQNYQAVSVLAGVYRLRLAAPG